MNRILPFLLLCAFVLQVMPVGAQQQMFLQRTQQSGPPPSATDFRILVNTENAGVSNPDQFQFTGALGDYDVQVWDQTGTTQLQTITGLSDAATITIAAGGGTYELRVFPAATNGFNQIRFNNGGDRQKLLEVRNWGEVAWSTMELAFHGCSNLGSEKALDAPDLSNVTNMDYMFLSCVSFNADIGDWDVSNVESFRFTFNNATSFNQDIGGWDMSSAQDISFMFRLANAFNQDIGGWDVSNVTAAERTFEGNTAFDQDIGGWDVRNISNMNEMFKSNTISTANYNALLIGWNSLPSLQSNVPFDAGNSKYTPGGAAEAAQTNLENTYNWIISDGGPL